MKTVVVSGRVNEEVKRSVDRVLMREGKTAADVIHDVWLHISITGNLPSLQQQEDEYREKRENFKSFLEFVDSASPGPDWLVNLTDDEMNNMIADDMRASDYV